MAARIGRWLPAVALAVLAACSGLEEGESCDPALESRDCAEGLHCAYSYDECPEYGCPRCRKACRSDADCAGRSCDALCVQQAETDERGMCKTCPEDMPWWP